MAGSTSSNNNKLATIEEAREKIKATFKYVWIHDCNRSYGKEVTDSSLDMLVSIVCQFPILATERIHFLNGDHMYPLTVLVRNGGSLVQVKTFCENVPGAIRPQIRERPGFAMSSHMQQFISCCSKTKPAVLLYLVQICPELLTCQEARYCGSILVSVVELGSSKVTTASDDDELEDLHDLICACFAAWPRSCGWKPFQAALMSTTPTRLLEKTIDKMVINFSPGEKIEIEHVYAADLVVTTKAAKVLGRILPLASSLGASGSGVTYATTEAFVAMMESLCEAVSGPDATLLQHVSLRMPSDLLNESKVARKAVLSVLMKVEHLPTIFLSFTSKKSATSDDNMMFEDIGRALRARNSALVRLELWDFRLSDSKGLDAILTSPHGATHIRLGGLLQFPLPTVRSLVGQLGEGNTSSLQDLFLHACWFEDESAFVSLLSILSQLRTLKRLKILGFEKTLSPLVTEKILEVVKHNRKLTYLELEYFQEAAFASLCEILADGDRSLRSLRVVLDSRTPQEIIEYDSNSSENDEDDDERSSDEEEEDESSVEDGDSSDNDEDDDDNSNADDEEDESIDEDADKGIIDRAQGEAHVTEKDDKVFLETALATTLMTANTNLTHCSLEQSYLASSKFPGNRDLCRQIEYYLRLNAYGRRYVRGHCQVALIESLSGVINSSPVFSNPDDDIIGLTGDWPGVKETNRDIAQVQLLFGLLREAPHIWAEYGLRTTSQA